MYPFKNLVIMKKKNRLFIILFAFTGIILLFTFSCKKDDTNTPDEETTMKDIDGNVYKTVTIGTQTWMAENLRTTRYNDSTLIPLPFAKSSEVIMAPYVCTYKYTTNADTIKTYGRLYNWYALYTGKLCPKGWHIPTDAEWTTLTNYLTEHGYNYDGSAAATPAPGTTPENMIGKALASSTGWLSSAIEGSVGNTDFPDKRNATGFTAFPGGARNEVGQFTQIGVAGYWWSFTESNTNTANAIGRSLINSNYSLNAGTTSKTCGFSVRCVKDYPTK
jgi:uncharacterized protein (TIGR02145 family)